MPRHTAKKGCKKNNNCAISSPPRRHSLPTLGSVFTPIERRKSARIANKRRRLLKMINVCADVWLTIFAFFCPAEVGLKFALLSYGFNALVATHFKTRKWPMLAWLKIIDRSRMIKENIDADFKNYKMCGTFPIPKQPVPASLRGFNRIYILHIDHNVIAFLHRIRCLFNEGIGLSLGIWPEVPFSPNRCWNVFGQEIWPLLLPYISSFNIYGGHHFSNLRHFISPTILRDCAHLRWVYASPSLDRLFPVLEHPADDGPEASPAQALFKWLHTARADGLPKVLNWLEMEHTRTASRAVEILKQEFLNASSTSGVSYIVYFECSSRKIEPFVLENAQTREQLTLQHHLTAFSIKRSPIFGDKKQWDGWLLEAGYKRWACLNNMIIIEITDAKIGPLSLPVNIKKCK